MKCANDALAALRISPRDVLGNEALSKEFGDVADALELSLSAKETFAGEIFDAAEESFAAYLSKATESLEFMAKRKIFEHVDNKVKADNAYYLMTRNSRTMDDFTRNWGYFMWGHGSSLVHKRAAYVSEFAKVQTHPTCLLYTSPSPRD